MKLDTNEIKALKFVCELASEYTSRQGCNDLDLEQTKMFNGFSVESDEEPHYREVLYDFDIICWLQNRLKEHLADQPKGGE